MANATQQVQKLTRSRFLRLFALGCASAAVLIACASNPTGSTASDTATDTAGQPLVVGTEGTYPPFSFRDLQTNELAGYDIDVAREVANRLGRPIEFVPTQWKSMLASLDARRFDFVANQVSVTPERQQQYAFSEPYTVSGAVVIVSNDNPKQIQSVADLNGKVVGTTQGSNYAAAAEEAGAEVKYYSGIAQVLSDLQQNRVDAALNDRLYVLTELKEANYNVQAVGEPFNEEVTAFAFNQENEPLRDEVNQVLTEMKQDGTLASISEKWFGEDVSN
ncbi:transporter substrate-binding domain-containing protein [Oculatella sp. LEGE 06141]|uniref:transporter substrate-binding domain-containing protein n=1 Tax=Oculatella sp. LEGE 06141 TaxID=1828648 RepID=UPI0018819AB3|nr:transporter substrate-binding domain-containing protein [Oculatella sp. LEGE 06141]MBE9181334.1 transporter substrate-binding domain-containing protein [Oculatella sp. LEGE 06141]